MGVATAFYLSELGVGPNVTVVEPQDIACAASGDGNPLGLHIRGHPDQGAS